MRTSTLAGLFAVAFIVACFVDRPSEQLECATDNDCTGYDELRKCTGGYCVVPQCPSDCTACDEAAKTCQVDCSSTDDCEGTIDCPAGWYCTINCVGTGACNNINCASNARCTIACSGSDACGDVQCSNACQCDLDCPTGSCGSMSCPQVGGGGNPVRCTAGGASGAECDSTVDSRCASC